MPRVCIIGAGGVGGSVIASLASAARCSKLAVIARGRSFAALREHGLRVDLTDAGAVQATAQVQFDGDRIILIDAGDLSRSSLEAPDFLILACKQGEQLTQVARLTQEAALVGPHTCIVPLINGMPWWYFYGLPDPRRLQSVDPSGVLWDALPPSQVLGATVYISATRTQPALINNNSYTKNLLIVGELEAGDFQSRADAFRQLFEGASRPFVRVDVSTTIRDAVWDKMVANLSYNALSGITGAAGERLATVPALRELGCRLIAEAQTVGTALSQSPPVRFGHSPEGIIDHIAVRHPLGSNKKPSMRQDIERGEPTERGAIVQAIQEMGRLTGMPTPTVDVVLTLLEEVEWNAIRRGHAHSQEGTREEQPRLSS